MPLAGTIEIGIIDVEADRLVNPTKIWLIVVKDKTTGVNHVFRNVHELEEKRRFQQFAETVSHWVGHNILGWDLGALDCVRILPTVYIWSRIACNCTDTLVVSKLVDYSREAHSIKQYGIEFGLEKGDWDDWSGWSEEMEKYCIRDVDICERIFNKYAHIISSSNWASSLDTEQRIQLLCNDMSDVGFYYDRAKAEKILSKVNEGLAHLDGEINASFRPRLVPIAEVSPRLTKSGALNKSDFRWYKGNNLSEFNGGPFVRCEWKSFNPSSPVQIVEVLNKAGWAPTHKTKTHIEVERRLNRLKHQKRDKALDLEYQELYTRFDKLKISGWKINEDNLNTLPDTAPASARTLAQRILLESRRKSLTEQLGLVGDDSRMHGTFYGIGAWTHRMAHQKPNMANIPTGAKLYGNEMRSLWRAPRNRLLVGVDAKGIQLRVFAHYVNDPILTEAVLHGDPHNLTKETLGEICRSRQAAKRFLYSVFLGAGIPKISEILDCSAQEASVALETLLNRYPEYRQLKEEVIPKDARRGWFTGLDGRAIRIPGDTIGQRSHLAMSGYLQAGEAVIMKRAALKFWPKLKSFRAKLVNFVHDEWQVEVPNDMAIALEVAKLMCSSLEDTGKELNLNIPIEGSYWSEDHKDYSIGTNWSVTH
jgi:DNA polymerase family A